ncbi:MAG: hypothetical protein KC944_04580 [Candidatus Omnitrophica bacterium]|nr:hypothetical protein [Candidatus Omnitrophota bacterium]
MGSAAMVNRKKPFSPATLACLVALPLVLGFLLLTDQSLPFPLGGHYQNYLAQILKDRPIPVEESWILQDLDRTLVKFVPRARAFLVLDLTRRWMGLLGLLGLTVWVGRSVGWIPAVWVGSIGIALLPFRTIATSLEPQSLFLALFLWGCCLSFGKPWSKTGTAEQFGGGLFVGLSAFSAPLAFLFPIPLLLRAFASRSFRRNLEQPFWVGLAVGLAPGILWVMNGRKNGLLDFGVRPETWNPAKLMVMAQMFQSSFGLLLLGLLALGIAGSLVRRPPFSREALDLTAPALVAIGLGEADIFRAALVVPGILLFGMIGLQTIGGVFVARKEKVLIPTVLALGLAYHLFFWGMHPMRDRQAHSREVGSLANLVVNHIPDSEPVCLFRLNPVLDYLAATLPPRQWEAVDPALFQVEETGEMGVKRVVFNLADDYSEGASVWVDPKRLGEPRSMGGAGKDLKERLFQDLNSETYLGENGAELSRLLIPTLKPPIRGKLTTIPAPGESGE